MKKALEDKGHKVTLLQYPNERATDEKLSWNIDIERGIATRNGKQLILKDFDGVMVRSWGTAAIAAEYAKVFEKLGITIANDIDKTTKSNSKVATTKIFQDANVSMPYTEAYLFSELKENDLLEKIKAFAKGKELFVVKSAYGTRGEKVQFFDDPEKAKSFIVSEKQANQKGFVLQDFCNTGKKASSYRVLVVGGKVVVGMELTSTDDKLISNVSAGGTTRLLGKEELDELQSVAARAAVALGMECCSGVDIIRNAYNKKELFVLEANDGPGISTIVDKHGIPLHEWVAEAFVQKVLKNLGQKTNLNNFLAPTGNRVNNDTNPSHALAKAVTRSPSKSRLGR